MNYDKKTVLEHKGHAIELDVRTGKFSVDGLPVGDQETLDAAKKAIDLAVKALLDVKRRPVIVLDGSFWDRENDAEWIHGELTSFSAHRWSRGDNLHANVVRNKERREYDPENVYEDTKANREAMTRIVEITSEIERLTKERGRLLESMGRIEVPNLKRKGSGS